MFVGAFPIRLPAIAKTAIDQDADQQRKLSVVEALLSEPDDSGGLLADCNDPGDGGEEL